MLKLDSILVDVEAEANGQYIDIPDWDGVSLGVRSLNCPAYKIAVDQLRERFARIYKGKVAPLEDREKAIGELIAKHILFGWKGIDPAYTPAIAAELLPTPQARQLVEQIVWAAQRVAETDAEFTADAVKN